MKIVGRSEFADTVRALAERPALVVDVETTGLRPYQGDRIFSVIFAAEEEEWYFNFNTYPLADCSPEYKLPRAWIRELQPIFEVGLLLGHNLKFDLHHLAQEGITPRRKLWCTMAQARVAYNEHMKYSLDACAQRIGKKKDDAVKAYIDQNDLFDRIPHPDQKKPEKRPRYDKVPFALIVPYGCQDARITWDLWRDQEQEFERIAASRIGSASIHQVVENECELTRVCFRLERTGIRVNLPYCKEAFAHEKERAALAATEFQKLGGVKLVDSAVSLTKAFHAVGVHPARTEKGNPSFTAEVLEPQKEQPLVRVLLEYRDAMKRANTYFFNFIKLTDPSGRIHADLRQSGAVTGRFGCRDPNLQNLTKEDDSIYPVRRAFIPDPDTFFLSIDYKQMEYRLMLDYAQETGVIEDVLAGVDIHDACAKMMGVTRSEAKTINFGLLYGAGVQKLANMLGTSYAEGKRLRQLYFERLPRVRAFIQEVQATAAQRGHLFNWMGRRCYFPDANFAFKGPNTIIQGGSADIIKKAMVELDRFLEGRKTRLLMNIHDECLFGLHHQELSLAPELSEIMARAYPFKKLPMACSTSWSEKSWFDTREGLPA